jgi:hypothetical protein
MTELQSILAEVQRTHFWGALELSFHAGELVLIRKTETIKPREVNNRDAQHTPRQ